MTPPPLDPRVIIIPASTNPEEEKVVPEPVITPPDVIVVTLPVE
jgi:hypothetical protein